MTDYKFNNPETQNDYDGLYDKYTYFLKAIEVIPTLEDGKTAKISGDFNFIDDLEDVVKPAFPDFYTLYSRNAESGELGVMVTSVGETAEEAADDPKTEGAIKLNDDGTATLDVSKLMKTVILNRYKQWKNETIDEMNDIVHEYEENAWDDHKNTIEEIISKVKAVLRDAQRSLPDDAQDTVNRQWLYDYLSPIGSKIEHSILNTDELSQDSRRVLKYIILDNIIFDALDAPEIYEELFTDKKLETIKVSELFDFFDKKFETFSDEINHAGWDKEDGWIND